MAASDWIPAAELLDRDLVPGPTDAARRKWLQRFCEVLLRVGDSRRDGRVWLIRTTAKIHNTQIATLLIDRSAALSVGPKPPANFDRWNDKDHTRNRDTRTLLALYDDYAGARRGVDVGTCLVAFAGSIHPDCGMRMDVWCEQRKLTISERTLRRYRDRMDPRSPNYDGNVDGRGRWVSVVNTETGEVVSKQADCDPRAWQLFLDLMLGRNALGFAQAYRFVEGESRIHNWKWPSDSAVRRRYDKEVDDATRTLRREGPRAFEAKCVPKMKRDFSDILAGTYWCLDARTFDHVAKVPDSRSEFRETRFTVHGLMDMRSKSFKFSIRQTECIDGYLAVIKAALLDWGAAEDVLWDNGESLKAIGGSKRGTPRQRELLTDPARNLLVRLGMNLHISPPYSPWAKPEESLWRAPKEGLDRWMWSFWGGSPGERPEDQSKEVKRRIDDLPALEEVQAALDTWAIEYHATPQSGAGMRGLSPNLVMQQYRGTIRRVDPSVVETECRRTVGPLRKTARGFTLNHIQYGRWDEAVWRLPRGEYLLKVDPDRADRIIVADTQGKPLCEATARQISGCTQEHRREAARLKSKYRRIVRESVTARDYIRTTDSQQVLAAKVRHAQAREADLAKSLPEAQMPAVQVVRPDLVEPARKVLAAAAKADFRAASEGNQTPVEAPSNGRKTGLQKLAEKARAEDAAERLRAAEAEKPKSYWQRLNFERGAAG